VPPRSRCICCQICQPREPPGIDSCRGYPGWRGDGGYSLLNRAPNAHTYVGFLESEVRTLSRADRPTGCRGRHQAQTAYMRRRSLVASPIGRRPHSIGGLIRLGSPVARHSAMFLVGALNVGSAFRREPDRRLRLTRSDASIIRARCRSLSLPSFAFMTVHGPHAADIFFLHA
jgi:hypothetical protein